MNPQEAAKFYRMAADKSDSNGYFSLALCYLDGRGVPSNGREAGRLLKLAAEGGHQQAQATLLERSMRGMKF
jgi:TPR repeat protein